MKMNLTARYSELVKTETPKEAIKIILQEDFNADVHTLAELSGLDLYGVGRIKGGVARAKKALKPEAKPKTLQFNGDGMPTITIQITIAFNQSKTKKEE